MNDKIAEMTAMAGKATEQMHSFTVDLFEKGVSSYFTGLEEVMKTVEINRYFMQRFFDGGFIPALDSLMDLEIDFSKTFFGAFCGEKDWKASFEELSKKIYAGSRYDQLVQELGGKIFGTATFDGEELLAENEFFKFYYIPPKKGVAKQDAALFHSGGILPYSDKLFRFLPETNFFDRFIERGIAVYSLELKGGSDVVDFGKLNLEKYIDIVDEMSDIAFKHNKNKLILEGYCGLGMQAWAYVLSKPKEADSKFKVMSTFVSPIDGSKCRILASMMQQMPQHMLLTQFTMSNLVGGGYVSGDFLRRTQDLALRGFFPKTSFGRFITGWKHREYASVEKVEDLTPAQRQDLAGAFWISPENCNMYPVPTDMARYSTRLFRTGVNEKGDIPYSYKGRKLTFQTVLKDTSLQVAGFYGGRDRMVPGYTANVLKTILKDRYTHVEHEKAGHVSYVLQPNVWRAGDAKALTPNPVDVLLELYSK